jgi:prephenate dehydrogenase
MNVTIVGLGLIGGSLALAIKKTGFCQHVVGVDANPAHAKQAVDLHLVEEVLTLDRALAGAQLVLVATPVKAIVDLLPSLLDAIDANTIVADMGSTKVAICDAVRLHPRRGRFVGAHPIAGTENSGPGAALEDLFSGKLAILCDEELSDPDAVSVIRRMFDMIRMRLVSMSSDAHDRHVAYVSHISHISSFVLATTVLEIEKSAATIFDLAGSGFESTVRLAKSSPDMWAPIFEQNTRYVCEALDAYIRKIQAFRDRIGHGDFAGLHAEMSHANEIRRILAGINGRSIDNEDQ